MNKKIIIGVVVALLVVLAVMFSKKGGQSGGTIKIGFIGPLTGDAAVYGEPLRNMVVLAVHEINKAGGVSGKVLEVIYEDGKCSGKDAVSAAQKLVNVDKVQVILGGFCSSESLAALPVAEAAKVVLFSPGSSSPDLTGKSPYFFRGYPSDASQGEVLAKFAYDIKKWKKIAFLQEQLDYPLGIYKAFSSNFAGEIFKEEFPTQTTDFRSIIIKLRSSNSGALFVDAQTPAVAERIIKQAKELGWRPQILMNDAISGDPKTIENNKEMLEGAIAAEFGVDSSNTKFQHMSQAYRERYGSEPPYQSYVQVAYDGVYILRDGIAAVGYDGEKLAAWSRTIKDWQGASGAVTIEASGDRAGGHVLKVVRGGKVELLK